MRYLSVCSGIEAASVAWHHLGWEPAAFSEIDPFPSAVLAHRFPGVPNLGDMTKHQEWNVGPIDLLVGGTPCQSFSVAGLRRGLHDPRGGLMLTYLEIARSLRPRWIVWENVPGVLSSGGGRDFGAFLGALGEQGYGIWPTGCWTLNGAEHTGTHAPSRSDGDVSSLSDVLETGAVPPRFSLSAKACSGILRRAERRGKTLPPMLRIALEQVAGPPR